MPWRLDPGDVLGWHDPDPPRPQTARARTQRVAGPSPESSRTVTPPRSVTRFRPSPRTCGMLSTLRKGLHVLAWTIGDVTIARVVEMLPREPAGAFVAIGDQRGDRRPSALDVPLFRRHNSCC